MFSPSKVVSHVAPVVALMLSSSEEGKAQGLVMERRKKVDAVKKVIKGFSALLKKRGCFLDNGETNVNEEECATLYWDIYKYGFKMEESEAGNVLKYPQQKRGRCFLNENWPKEWSEGKDETMSVDERRTFLEKFAFLFPGKQGMYTEKDISEDEQFSQVLYNYTNWHTGLYDYVRAMSMCCKPDGSWTEHKGYPCTGGFEEPKGPKPGAQCGSHDAKNFKDYSVLKNKWGSSWKSPDNVATDLLFRGSELYYVNTDESAAVLKDGQTLNASKLLQVGDKYIAGKFNSWSSNPASALSYAKPQVEKNKFGPEQRLPAILILKQNPAAVAAKEKCHWIASLSWKPDDVETLCPQMCAEVKHVSYSPEGCRKQDGKCKSGVVWMEQVPCKQQGQK